MRIFNTVTRTTRTVVSILEDDQTQLDAEFDKFKRIVARVLDVRVALIGRAVDGYFSNPLGFYNTEWYMTPAELSSVVELCQFKTAIRRTLDAWFSPGPSVEDEKFPTALVICNLNTGLSGTWAVLLR